MATDTCSRQTAATAAAEEPLPKTRRAPWRQRLVEAERGFTLGFRGDSIFFVHMFCICMIVAFGAVLGITPGRWIEVVLAVSVMLSAEFLNAALKAALTAIYPDAELPDSARKATYLGTAAVTTAVIGGMLAIAMIYAQPFLPILRD